MMRDDFMLERLGEAEQAAQMIPDRWRRLAEGEASATEVASLRAEAREDDQAALLWERFRPLEDADEQEIADAMLAHQRASRRASPRWIGAGVAAAAAAAAFAWSGSPNESLLPGYALQTSTPDIGYRGEASEAPAVPEHHPQSAISLVLRPATPVAAPVSVQAFALVDNHARPLAANWEISDAGAARLDAVVQDLLPDFSGPLTLVAVVRSAGSPAISPKAMQRAHDEGRPPNGTQWVRYAMRVVTN